MTRTSTKISWQTIGHNSPKQYLQNAIAEDKLAHAYLLVGEKNIGKTTFSKDAAALLLSTSQPDKSVDYYEIDKDEIKVEDMRGLLSRFSLSSASGGKKIAVIANIQNATLESLNALLKMLEEPKGETVFFLTVTHTGMLPDTVISRAQKLFFTKSDEVEIEKALEHYNLSAPDKKTIANLARGKIGLALRFVKNSEYLEETLQQVEILENFLAGTLPDRLAIASEIAGKENIEIKLMFEKWIEILREKLFVAKKEDANIVYLRIKSLQTALSRIALNANRKIVMDLLATAV